MSARITKNHYFEPDKSLRRLADRVCRVYPEYFGHIDLKRVAFMMETTGNDSGACAVCHKVSTLARAAFREVKKPTDFVIAFFSSECEGKSQQWMQMLMFHELLHIGVDGKLVEHDIQEFMDVVRLAGLDWQNDDDLPDIIRKQIKLVA
ncbi:MAG: putative metallopeptidase [Armatimonadota bacterium]